MSAVEAGQTPRVYRYEVKFVAARIERSLIDVWIRSHWAGFRVAYPPRRVNNIYFDDHELRTFEENLSGISRRAKVRFRWYGTDGSAPSGMLELKFKRNRLGWKESYRLMSVPMAGRSWGEIINWLRSQLPFEARTWLDAHPQPVLINRYWRHYWVSANGRVRVTVDEDQKVYDQRLHSAPNFSSAANLPDALIVEVKADSRDYALAGRAIQGIPIRAGRHSKYVVGVQSILAEG